MKDLFASIETHKNALHNHGFCQLLRHCSATSRDNFSFVPHMAFFVMGFKDMLKNMDIPQPKNAIEATLHQHCHEDSDHWEWFLQDLQTLNLDVEYWGGDIPAIISLIWSDTNFDVRNQVYRIMHYILLCKTPHEKLILIECLEAAFATFVNNLNVLSKKAGLYSKLKYFGEHHYNQEANHAMGSWLDERQTKTIMPEQAKYSIREEAMQNMIDNIFSGFSLTFSAWENALLTAGVSSDLPVSSAA